MGSTMDLESEAKAAAAGEAAATLEATSPQLKGGSGGDIASRFGGGDGDSAGHGGELGDVGKGGDELGGAVQVRPWLESNRFQNLIVRI